MAKKPTGAWRVIVRWRDDIDGLDDEDAHKLFARLKDMLAEVSKGHHYPEIELREGPILRDYHQVTPK